MRKFAAEKIWLDHFLALVPGIMGVYAVAMSLGKSQLAMTMAFCVGIAAITGYGLSLVFEGTKTHGVDAWLFAITGTVGFFSARSINNMLPEEGFPFAILAAVMMFALLMAGALFAWRDETLLFTSLPSLVLFGLVGTIDTWRPGLFYFCGFLLAVALLYARVHQRSMIKHAERTGADAKLLRRDVWKWMAGPEYAFAAAGTIILLSFVGAPVVQTSLTGVSSNFRVNIQRTVRNSIQQGNLRFAPPSDVPVGRGPVNLSDRIIFTAGMSEPRYLKNQIFGYYRMRGWSKLSNKIHDLKFIPKTGESEGTRDVPIPTPEQPARPKDLEVTLHSAGAENIIPTPGPVQAIKSPNVIGDQFVYQESENGLLFKGLNKIGEEFSYVSQVTNIDGIDEANPKAGISRQFSDSSFTNQKIKDEAVRITQGITGDYAKLIAIKNAIAKQCQYNTQTPATPQGQDVAEHFYFDAKQGYCDHFATTFTVMAKALGMPARYVTGYLIDPGTKDSNGDYIVRENQSHAWSEVLLEGYGWVVFDATEGTIDITPEKTTENKFLASIREFLSKNASSIFAVIGIGALAGVFVLWQRRPTSEDLQNPRRAAVLTTNRFQKSLEKIAGHPKRFSQTHREFIEFHKEALGEGYAPAIPILNRVERAWFGKDEFDPEDLKELGKDIAAYEILAKKLSKDNKGKA